MRTAIPLTNNPSQTTTIPPVPAPSTLRTPRVVVINRVPALGEKQLPHRIITAQPRKDTHSISNAVAAISPAIEPPTMPSRRTVSASPSRPFSISIPHSAPIAPNGYSRLFLTSAKDPLATDLDEDTEGASASASDAVMEGIQLRSRVPSARRASGETGIPPSTVNDRNTEYHQSNEGALNSSGSTGNTYYASALVDELSLSPVLNHGISQRATSPGQYVYRAPCERHPAENQPNYVVNDKFPKCQNDVSHIAFGIRVSDFLPVAFKTIRDPTLAKTELAILRHLAQCRRTARCPHITRLMDTFVDDQGLPVLVTKMFQKLTWIDCNLIDIAGKAKELMLALKAIHSVGIAHLDVNPANLMMDSKGRLVLIDFGLARECVPETGINRRASAVTDPTSKTGMGICCNYCNRQSPSESMADLSSKGTVKRLVRFAAGEQSSDNLVCLARESREMDFVPPSTRVNRHWRGRERSPFQKTIAASVVPTVYSTSCPVPSFLAAASLSDLSPDSQITHHMHYLMPHPTRGTPGYIAPELYLPSAMPTDRMDDTASYFHSECSSAYALPVGAPDLYSAGVVIGTALAPYIPDCDLHFLGGSMIRKDTTNQIVDKLERFIRSPFTKQRCPLIVIMAAEMLRGLLDEDPRRRMTASEALRSPFLMALEEGGGTNAGSSSVPVTPITPTGPVVFSSRVARFFEGTDRISYDARLREWEWALYQSERSCTTYGSYGQYDGYQDANEGLRCR